MSCYDNNIANGAVGSGAAAGCTLPVTGPEAGMMNYVSMALFGITAIFVGLLLIQMTRQGTRIPILRRWFPYAANEAVMSPTSTGRHGNWVSKHRR